MQRDPRWDWRSHISKMLGKHMQRWAREEEEAFGSEEGEENGSEEGWKEVVRKERTPVMCQRVSTSPSLVPPHCSARRPSSEAPIPVCLTFVARAELEQRGQQEGQQQKGHGAV